jgi:hypothetical protein
VRRQQYMSKKNELLTMVIDLLIERVKQKEIDTNDLVKLIGYIKGSSPEKKNALELIESLKENK